MPVEVLPGGNVRVYDDDGRFVAGYGSAVAQQMGLTEPSARDVLRRATTQLQDTITRGADTGSIEINGQEYTSEPSQQDRDAAAVAQETLASLEAVAPMAKSGMVDADMIRQIVGRSISESFSDQRLVRKAARDMQAIQRLSTNGTHDQTQTMKVLQSLEAEYGPEVLMRVPGYADFVGLRSQLDQAKEETLTSFAESRGLDRRYVTWDERANKPTYNTTEFAIDEHKSQIRKDQLNAATAPLKAKIDSLTGQISTVTKAIQSAQTAGKDVTPLLRQHDRLTNELFGAYRQIDQMAPGSGAPAQQTVEESPEVETDLDATVESAPASPVAEPVTYKRYTRAEAEAAARSGQIPMNGTPVVIDGVTAVLTPQGFKRVR